VHSTLGVLGYQWPFIPGFTKIAKPLTDLLKKEQSFQWTDECTKVVDKLITIVTNNPVLYHPNYDKPFTLEVDASQYAIGAILQQADNLGKLHPVGYYLKALTDAERGYDIHDRELLALVKGLDHWQCHGQVTVSTFSGSRETRESRSSTELQSHSLQEVELEVVSGNIASRGASRILR
jgi:RNase H-like domain found in reverse transcriptase